MDLIKAWEEAVNSGKVITTGNPTTTVAMLESRASAYNAIENRRKEREQRLGRSGRSYRLGHELYWRVAEYYVNNYMNGQLRQHPLDEDTKTWHDHRKTEENKQRYYYKCKYEEVLNTVKSDLNSSLGRSPSDDELIEYLFSLMPDNAFSQDELDIWQKIYGFANNRTAYIAVKRSDRRTKKTKSCTYLNFAAWLANNSEDYSSKDRNFVAHMVEYYNNTIPAKKVDELLRYNGSRQYFSEGDLTALGLTTQANIDDFFKTIDIINQTCKKK